jgi:hypothetical protein
MQFLFFVCPTSRQPFDSGIALDASAFRQTRAVTLRLCCPTCLMQHELTVGTGFLSENSRQTFPAAA